MGVLGGGVPQIRPYFAIFFRAMVPEGTLYAIAAFFSNFVAFFPIWAITSASLILQLRLQFDIAITI